MSIVDASGDNSVLPMVAQAELDWDLSIDQEAFVIPPDLPYLSTQWEQHLDLLQHLSHHNNLLLVVVGEKGIGKTTLLKQFLAEALPNASTADLSHMQGHLPENDFSLLVDENTKACCAMGDVGFDQRRLVDLITESFDLPETSVENLQEQLDTQIENLQKLPHQSLLIIDDAHLLPLETLQAILYLLTQQSETQMRLHVLLLGSEALRRNLDRISDQQIYADLICLLELEALNYHETEQYLQHYLKYAGRHELEWFSPEQVERIHQLSRGVPLQINHFARQLLTTDSEPFTGDTSMMASLQNFFEQNRNKLIGGLVVLALIIVLVYSISSRDNNTQTAAIKPKIEMEQAAQATTNTVAQAVAQQQNLQPNAPITTMAANGANTDIQDQAIKNTTPGSVPDNPQMDQGYSNKKPPAIIIEMPKGANGNPANKNNNNNNDDSSKNTQSNNPSKQEAVSQTDEESPALDVQVKDKTVIIQHKKPNETTKAKAANGKTPAPAAKSTAAASNAKGAYALQLIGLSDKQRVNSFISSNHLQGKVTYRQSKRDGKDWFVIFYGNYASMQQAQAAVKNLPKSLQDMHPWPRRIDSTSGAVVATKKPVVHHTAAKAKTQCAQAKTTTQPKSQTHHAQAKTTTAKPKTQMQASAKDTNTIVLKQSLEG